MDKLEVREVEAKVNIAVFGKNGQVSSLGIKKSLLDPKVKPGMIAQVVRIMLSREHQGTLGVKDRSEVAGGGRKPWKQKGTGRARQGSIRSPQWVGGGVVHGPQGEKRRLVLPKSWGRKALKELLKQAITEEALVLIEDFSLEKPNTKELLSVLASIKSKGKTLLILDKLDKAIFLSSRNIPNLTLTTLSGLNILRLLRSDTIVVGVNVFEELKKILGEDDGK